MAYALFRQALADLRSRRMQVLQLLLILTAAASIVMMTSAIQFSAGRIWDRVFTESNGAHAFFRTQDPRVDLTRVSRMTGVTEASAVFPLVSGPALVQDPIKIPPLYYGVAPEPASVNRPLVTEGRWLSAQSDDEIVLDPIYADDIQVRVGQRVDVLTARGPLPLMVVGLALNSNAPYPQDTLAAYVLPGTLARIEPDRARWEQGIDIRLADPQHSEVFVEQATAQFTGMAVNGRDWQSTRASAQIWNQINLLFLRICSLFALIAVGLIIANATSAFILARFREMALLKAIGFTPAQITALLLLEHLGLALIAGIVGIVVGFLLMPLFLPSLVLRRTAGLLPSGWWLIVDPALALSILLGLLLVVTIFTALPAWRGGQIATVQGITVGATPVRPRPSRLAGLAARLGLPPVIVLGVKDAFARPWRAIFTVAGLAVTIAMTTIGLGTDRIFRAINADPTVLGQLPGSVFVQRVYFSDAETRRLLEAHPEVRSYIAYAPAPAQVPDQPVVIRTQALDRGYEQMRLTIPEGRMFAAPGEAIVAQGLLDQLALKVGDELRLRMRDRPLTLRIVGRYVATDSRGLRAMFSLETLRQQIDPATETTEYVLQLAPGTDAEAVRENLLRAAGGQLAVLVWRLDAQNEQLHTSAAALSVALLLIGVINVLNTALLGVQERVRDLGVLKAIGLTPGQVVVSVVTGVSVLALLAMLIGVPLGIVLIESLFAAVVRLFGGGSGAPLPINWAWLLLLLPIALLVTALASAVPARRAARIPVVEVLRYE